MVEAGGWSLMKHREGVLTTGLRAWKGKEQDESTTVLCSLALQT